MTFQDKDTSAHPIHLFIPCLVDQLYPEIGIATSKILKHLGFTVFYDPRQTCCGQPAFNAGHRDDARRVAIEFVKIFSEADTIVGPSGSCVAMIRNYYPTLLAGHPLESQAKRLGSRIFELSEFIVQENLTKRIEGEYPQIIGFHNSCHSYRELGIDSAPIRILNQLRNIEIKIPKGDPVCCGFGGLFSIKFDGISAAMGYSRLKTFADLKVSSVVTNDPGCLMHMRQEAKARFMQIELYHYAEIIARAMQL